MSIGFTQIKAPFTKEQVDALQQYQNECKHHQFTCQEFHGTECKLVPTIRGWICPYCDYTQDWAYEFMTYGGIKID